MDTSTNWSTGEMIDGNKAHTQLRIKPTSSAKLGIWQMLLPFSYCNLCVTCDYRTKKDVWIMKEYGLAESWTKVASIPRFVNKVVWPIFISQNDEILLQDVSGLVWWYVSRDDDTFGHPENQTRCECDDRGELNLYIESHCDDRGELNLYIESLVSPNSLENV
ncbi:hypothetical protein RND71_027305 [Anisodus tanguticus]|uniref:F-box protein n=1 Tax=Anisodus tanguticus TaxID=243964 RepID=A0AAE1V1M3_9SOLA|nr:hypothetical protein RND71_027305 [Anisodus tanguticus]